MKKHHQERFGFDRNLNVIIAQHLKAKREQSGMTQRELAKRLNVSQTVIARIETAVDNITLTKLERYAEALETDITVKFPLNNGRTGYIPLTLDKKCESDSFHPSHHFGIHLANSMKHEKFLQCRHIKDSPSDTTIPYWSKKNSIIACNSVRIYHQLCLSN